MGSRCEGGRRTESTPSHVRALICVEGASEPDGSAPDGGNLLVVLSASGPIASGLMWAHAPTIANGDFVLAAARRCSSFKSPSAIARH